MIAERASAMIREDRAAADAGSSVRAADSGAAALREAVAAAG
jgi:hypothetical protein